MATVEITLAAAVRNQQRLLRKSSEDMADLLGLSHRQFVDLADGRWIPHQSTVIRLAKCFGSRPINAWLRHRLYSIGLVSQTRGIPYTDISDQLAVRHCSDLANTIVGEQLVKTPFFKQAVPLRRVFRDHLQELRCADGAPHDTDWVGMCRPELLPGGLPPVYAHPMPVTACVRILAPIPGSPTLRPKGGKSVLIGAAYYAMHGGYHVRLYRERRFRVHLTRDRFALLIYCPPQPDKAFDPWQGVTTPWIPTLPPTRRVMRRLELSKQDEASSHKIQPSGPLLFEYPEEA